MTVIGIADATPAPYSPATLLRVAVRHWRRQTAGPFGRYRPELHYMRGPGPKSAAAPRPINHAR